MFGPPFPDEIFVPQNQLPFNPDNAKMFFATVKSSNRYLFTIHISGAKRATRFCKAGSYYLLIPNPRGFSEK